MAGVKIMAESGRDYQSILRHYYTGVEIVSWDTNRNIRVGVWSDPSTITIISTGPFQVTDANGNIIGDGGANESYVITYSGGNYSVTKSGEPLPRYTGPSIIKLLPTSGDTLFQVSGWANWNSNLRKVRGSIEVRYITDSQYTSDNNLLWAINEVNLEEYVAGILEEPDGWPFEGLKVLAVAARTYALNKILYGGKHRNGSGNIFDVAATWIDQQYIGVWNGPNHRLAQQQTAGQVVTYGGKPIVAAYSGSCPGGRTKSSEEAGWGYYPYLRSVSCTHVNNTNSLPPGNIYGRVISKTTGKAIAGTAVRAGDKVVPTVSTGEFRITGLSPGTYTVYYDAPGYQGQTQEGIIVNSNATTTTPMVILSPPSGEIRGRVIDRAGRKVPGTAVRINSSVMPTNPGGEFRFTRVYNGIYTIYYDAPGYPGQIQEGITVNGGLTRPPTVIMAPLGEIYGRVISATTGKAIPGTAVRINSSVMPTNGNGELRFTLVYPGVYTIYYDAPGYKGQVQERIAVVGGVTRPPTVILSP